jgi:hypothetical protein
MMLAICVKPNTSAPPKQIGFFIKLLDSSSVYVQASDSDTIDVVNEGHASAEDRRPCTSDASQVQ